ncbi:hypothetical protein [Brevundimonas sp. SORGH_AS_0993]|uniref:hypothetical protein n=1 Tax=Brevundimonas sp. SORGH_AS_0993 TaxID=3041794 RepID=UPI0027838BC3|nr:hypothetical protein [Brevundimonas sp. SORGH_AS_0993]MDQ1154537.1 hypothetical protein [Brevundimonas sp. SORGH_AS_0993]
MTRDTQAVQDDIAYLRGLAHEGRNAPLLAGPILVTAGVVFGGANLCQWAIQSGLINVNPWAQLWLWVAAGVIFAGAVTVLIGRIKTKPGFHSASNRSVGAAWEAVGYGIFVTWLSLVALSVKTGHWSWMSVMPTTVLVAYGSAWMVGAAMTRTRWMSLTALASYAGAVAVAWFVTDPLIFPVFTAVLIAVALIPGLILMRQEPSEIV